MARKHRIIWRHIVIQHRAIVEYDNGDIGEIIVDDDTWVKPEDHREAVGTTYVEARQAIINRLGEPR